MGSTGEATDQDMLSPVCSPIHPRLLGRGRPGYFLMWLSDCMMETCMLQTGVRVYEYLVTPINTMRVEVGL